MNLRIREFREAVVRSLKRTHEKVCGFMDAVPLLQSKRAKLTFGLCMLGVAIVALFRMFDSGPRDGMVSGAAIADFDSAPIGAESPKAVVMQYYRAYKDGNPIAFLNCVNYTEDEKLSMINVLSEKMSMKDWRARAEITYAEITYECEELRPYDAAVGGEWATANVFVKASGEWEGSSKSSGCSWSMKKLGDRWFIDKDGSSGVHYMGLTDLSSPFPTEPGSTSF